MHEKGNEVNYFNLTRIQKRVTRIDLEGKRTGQSSYGKEDRRRLKDKFFEDQNRFRKTVEMQNNVGGRI